jgi:AcrR family transcriptional regulator
MRALPGRASRSSADAPVALTRENAHFDQRRRIIRATGELVAKRGYNDVTVEVIVKRAHVSFKTFYKHFPNKEACFLGVFESFVARSQEQIGAALAAEPKAAWPEQVVAALRALFELILAEPIIARACIVEGLTVSRALIPRYERSMRALSPLIRLGRDFNPEAAELPATLEDTLAGGVLWIPFQHLIAGEVERIEELLPEAVEFILRPYLGQKEAARWAQSSREKTSAPVSIAP